MYFPAGRDTHWEGHLKSQIPALCAMGRMATTFLPLAFANPIPGAGPRLPASGVTLPGEKYMPSRPLHIPSVIQL